MRSINFSIWREGDHFLNVNCFAVVNCPPYDEEFMSMGMFVCSFSIIGLFSCECVCLFVCLLLLFTCDLSTCCCCFSSLLQVLAVWFKIVFSHPWVTLCGWQDAQMQENSLCLCLCLCLCLSLSLSLSLSVTLFCFLYPHVKTKPTVECSFAYYYQGPAVWNKLTHIKSIGLLHGIGRAGRGGERERERSGANIVDII